MTKKAEKTGPGPMAFVALEQEFPEDKRIVNDRLARKILPLGMRVSIDLKLKLMSLGSMVKWTERQMPGMWGGFMCRKRYIDDKLTEVVDSQINRVVNLGAGFDTRAYRLSALSGVPVWEADQPENINAKKMRLKKVLGQIPPNIKLVPMDFNTDEPGDVLTANGFTVDEKTFFILEAVTQYLPEDNVRKTFDYLSKAQAGSRLVFTYIREDFLDGKALYGHQYLYEKMIARDRSWLFGLSPQKVADFLSDYGWRLLEHYGYDDLAERYVKPTGRALLSTPMERIVYGEKN